MEETIPSSFVRSGSIDKPPDYLVWTGTVEDLRFYFNSDDGKEYLNTIPAGHLIRIWCPEDRNAVVKVTKQNAGKLDSNLQPIPVDSESDS